ncbi:MAG: twin-arginine translocase subunit TatB [Alphaproteobacteria bacterium]|nr:twin-arginine translocase subunit TatB [Alphaproteobacteria bacterium]
MFGLGLGELLLIGVVALLVVGPEHIPPLMRDIGRFVGQMRRAADDLRRAFVLEADRMDEEDRLRKLKARREQADAARKEAEAQTGGLAQPAPEVAAGAPADAQTGGLAQPAPDDSEVPPGMTPEEWASYPKHIRDRVLAQRRARDSDDT